MPGLFGVFGRSPGADADLELAPMERALQPRDGEPQRPYLSIRRAAPFAAAGLLHHGVLDEPAASRDEVSVVLDGWLWPRIESVADAETPAETCLRLYAVYGVDFLDHVDGEFTLALIDHRRRRAVLANDRFGLRALQVYRTARSFYFAPEAKAIVAAGAVGAELDLGTVHRYLSFGRIFLDAGTFFRGVEVLEPSTTLVFDARSGDFTAHRRSHSTYRPRTATGARALDALADDVAEGLRRGVRRRLRPGLRYGMHLSGGLDSRLIAGVVAGELGDLEGANGLLACTFGMEDSGEVVLAEEIAGALDLDCRSLTLDPAAFVDAAAAGVWRTEGLDLLTQSYAFEAFPRFAPEVDVMTTGLALDLPLGGSFLTPELVAPGATLDDGFAHIARKARTLSPELLGRLLGHSSRAEQSEAELRDLWSTHAADRDEAVPDLVDGFMLRWRVWRVIIQR
ncbi:MAG: asparagine synthase-related protein, partial [Acidobacteriota bacterium]